MENKAPDSHNTDKTEGEKKIIIPFEERMKFEITELPFRLRHDDFDNEKMKKFEKQRINNELYLREQRDEEEHGFAGFAHSVGVGSLIFFLVSLLFLFTADEKLKHFASTVFFAASTGAVLTSLVERTKQNLRLCQSYSEGLKLKNRFRAPILLIIAIVLFISGCLFMFRW